MIDPHVHLRDWRQAAKETVRHGLEVGLRAGLDALFEMPNTDPPLTSRDSLEQRIALADSARRELAGEIGHGMYAGITARGEQLREVVHAHAALFPRVVGLKLFAGQSTGGMGIVGVDAQREVYRSLAELGYRGVLAVHAEKEGDLTGWEPARPATHARARPPLAEVHSVEDQLRLAAEEGFRGLLHIAHVSVPATVDLLRGARRRGLPFRVSCGLTPHHALLAEEDMEGPDGILLKMNPPLRPREMQRSMLAYLAAGEIDWIESDHAPHTVEDKRRSYASGIPVLPFYPRFLLHLREAGVSAGELDSLTHGRIEGAFGFRIPRAGRAAEPDLAREYPFDPFEALPAVEGAAAGAPAPILSIIAAVDRGGLIGRGGGLPWRAPGDLRRFRSTTMGHAVIMGRRTYEGLPGPLEGRALVVMSRDPAFRPEPGVQVARSVGEALLLARGAESFVAGGAETYRAFLPLADRLYLTVVLGEHAGDAYFPSVDWGSWRLVSEESAEGDDGPACTFRRYERRGPR